MESFNYRTKLIKGMAFFSHLNGHLKRLLVVWVVPKVLHAFESAFNSSFFFLSHFNQWCEKNQRKENMSEGFRNRK